MNETFKPYLTAHTSTPRRTCLLIMGMHRSGTSALTRVMSLLGAGLPKNLLGATDANAEGHWEPAHLVTLHDQMLTEAGSTWDDCRRFDLAGLSPIRKAQFRAAISHFIANEYGDAPLIVLKDPRICRFAPFYAELLEGMGYELKFVHALRNPLSVAASLEKRDGMPTAYGKLLWLRHALDAEFSTRGHQRVFLSYESLMADWRGVVARINGTLDLNWSADAQAGGDIDAFLNRKHTHHEADAPALASDSCHWLATSHHYLRRLEADANDAISMAELDLTREAFEHASRHVAAPILSMFSGRIQQLASENATFRGRQDTLAAENEMLRETIIGLRGQISYTTRLSPGFVAAPQLISNSGPRASSKTETLPVFLISYNRGAMLERAIAGLRTMNRPTRIIVHDNGSSDDETLDVLARLAREDVEVVRNAPIHSADDLNLVDATVRRHFERAKNSPYIVSDCDIDIGVADPSALDVYLEMLDLFPDAQCVGPMLRIRDVPETYPLYTHMMNRHIEQFWRHQPEFVETASYGRVAYLRSQIDTTLALHRAGEPFRRLKTGLRLYEPFEALHLDWYNDSVLADLYATTSNAAISHWNNLMSREVHRKASLAWSDYTTVRRAPDGALHVVREQLGRPLPLVANAAS